MAEKLTEMGFTSSIADPDVWLLRAATKADGEEYYKYILMYVDDILAISVDPKGILEDVQRTFKLKNDKIEPPDFYLGAKFQEKMINGIKCWTITSQEYVKAAVKNVEEGCRNSRWKMPTGNVHTPINATYTPP